jgi:methionyl-tRNA synthetase
MYVWFDALSNYITAIGFGNDQQQKAVGSKSFGRRCTWSVKTSCAFMRFTGPLSFWPRACSCRGRLSRTACGLIRRAGKMSKTLGNTIELDVLIKFFPIDAIRYFCLREMVFGQDGRFGYENLIDRTNSDLASGLGNLSSRTLTMIERYCGGQIPAGTIPDEARLSAKRTGVETDDAAIRNFLSHARDEFVRYVDALAFSKALEEAWAIVARTDKMISEAKPWDLAKDAGQVQTLNAVLYRAAETLRWLAVMLYPIMPSAAREIYAGLGLQDDPARINPAALQWGDLPAGDSIGEVKPLFPRIEKAKTMEEIRDQKSEVAREDPGTSAVAEGSGQPATAADACPGVASYIDINDFAKIELRVGEVRTAERIPKADKLLLITVDIGEEKPRQILAGIAQYYEPENLVGRKIVVVANLKPRKLRGYESQGMLLAASIGDEGKPVIATFAEDVPNGARLK